ncbi:MAG: RHS repeat-associated core domain-containing protein, partial [Bacteroidales bacterium]|nr:RHS repeat-associated core domain-containing protein [Bacteroidales bacterium]
PCRPTACVKYATNLPSPSTDHCSLLGYRYVSPNGDGWAVVATAAHFLAQSPSDHCSLITVHSSYTFSAKERDTETGLSYFGSRYYSSDLSIWLSVDPQAAKYPSLSPYTYCANNPVKLVDPNGEEIGEPPLKRIVNLGFQSKTFRKLFRKSGLTIENMSDIISFGNQSIMNPYTKKITLRDANSDMGNVIALAHEMTNRIHAKKLKNNMESVRKGDISYETFADNAIRIESEGVANQIIVASELNYSFPDDNGVMNDLKTQYKEGTIRRREMLNTIKESDFQDEFGGDTKKDYYEQGKKIRESQIRREKQSKSGF